MGGWGLESLCGVKIWKSVGNIERSLKCTAIVIVCTCSRSDGESTGFSKLKETQNGFIYIFPGAQVQGPVTTTPVTLGHVELLRPWCLFDMTQGHMNLTLDSRKDK